MSEQEARAEAWVAWDAAQYTTPPSFGGKRLANVSAGDAFYAGWAARAEWERARHVTDERNNRDLVAVRVEAVREAQRKVTPELVNRLLFKYDNDHRFGVVDFAAALSAALGGGEPSVESPAPGTLAYAQARAEVDGSLDDDEDGYDGPVTLGGGE